MPPRQETMQHRPPPLSTTIPMQCIRWYVRETLATANVSDDESERLAIKAQNEFARNVRQGHTVSETSGSTAGILSRDLMTLFGDTKGFEIEQGINTFVEFIFPLTQRSDHTLMTQLYTLCRLPVEA